MKIWPKIIYLIQITFGFYSTEMNLFSYIRKTNSLIYYNYFAYTNQGNTSGVGYISIYDKPKRGRGRPKTCKLSDGDKRQRNRETATRYHYDNYEYNKMRQRLQKQTAYVSKNGV